MSYRPPNHHAFAHLRNRRALELAMKARDVSGRELSTAVKTSPQNMSKLRRGINRRVDPGTLFEFDAAPVDDLAEAVSA
jgi:hypothetical protein